jgi:hypothetical protein
MPESSGVTAVVPRVAVITGAGVGRAAVEEFARQGYDIGLLSRDLVVSNVQLWRFAATACERWQFRPTWPMPIR